MFLLFFCFVVVVVVLFVCLLLLFFFGGGVHRWYDFLTKYGTMIVSFNYAVIQTWFIMNSIALVVN